MVKWKYLEEWLDHKHFWEITIKHHSTHRKHKYELVDKPQKKAMQQTFHRRKFSNQNNCRL